MSNNATKPVMQLLPKEIWLKKQREERGERIGGYILLAIIIGVVYFYFNGSFDGFIKSAKQNWLTWSLYAVGGVIALSVLWKNRYTVIGIAFLVGLFMLIKQFV